MTLTACPICSSTEYRDLYDLDRARWIPGKVVVCRQCQTTYKRPAPSARPISEYYDANYAAADYWNAEDASVKALSRILDTIGPPPDGAANRLLDVGCGNGVFLGLAKAKGWDVCGLDLNEVLARRASERVGAEVLTGDLLTVDFGERKFDVITLLDLIEHLTEPLPVLERCRKLLRPGGRLVIYTPNHGGLICRVAHAVYRMTFRRVRRPIDEIFDCTHVIFFDAASLRRSLEAAGFEVAATKFLAYDPSRSNQATGLAATALRAIELVSPCCGGPFRIIMTGRAPK